MENQAPFNSSNQALERKILFGSLVALSILFLLSVLSFLSVYQDHQNRSWVEHTHTVVETIQQLQIAMANNEAAVRGYVVISDPELKILSARARQHAGENFSELQRLTIDNPPQQENLRKLDPLITQRLGGLRRIQDLRDQSSASAQQAMQVLKGTPLSESIQRIVNAMDAEEKRLLRQRDLDQERGSQITLGVILLSNITAIMMLSYGVRRVHQDLILRQQAEQALIESEERFRLLVSSVKDYAIFMISPQGKVISWNEGAEKTKGYKKEEIIGHSIEQFYTEEDRQNGKPAQFLREAAEKGRAEQEAWRVKKDGSRFWADVVLTAIRDANGKLLGFAKVTRDITRRREHEKQIEELNHNLQQRADDLAAVNRELETFSYSVSHDLRAPLRAIDGFSREIAQNYDAVLDSRGKDYLSRIRTAAGRMAQLIDDLLTLSRVTRAEIHMQPVDLAVLAEAIMKELRSSDPKRKVDFRTSGPLQAFVDPRLMQIVLENLFRNAWKFTSKHDSAIIELGSEIKKGKTVYYVKDDGAGFDMAYSHNLFTAFQRLHTDKEFPGTGVGLATVQRIIHRHRGEVWAEGEIEKGATFHFTLTN